MIIRPKQIFENKLWILGNNFENFQKMTNTPFYHFSKKGVVLSPFPKKRTISLTLLSLDPIGLSFWNSYRTTLRSSRKTTQSSIGSYFSKKTWTIPFIYVHTAKNMQNFGPKYATYNIQIIKRRLHEFSCFFI